MPTEIGPVVTQVAALGVPVGIHLHDTRGLAITNALQAIDAGVVRVDGSVGGLGGCPFAPGASGNLALEDLAHALEAMGVDTGVEVTGLIEAARVACALAGRPVSSHVGVAGPRFQGTPFAARHAGGGRLRRPPGGGEDSSEARSGQARLRRRRVCAPSPVRA